MEHIVSLLYHVFASIIFCLALTLLLLGFDKINTMLFASKENINYGVVDVLEYNESEPNTTQGELLSLFLQELEQDIIINGVLYEKELSYQYVVDGIEIAATAYKKQCIYEESTGILQRVIYESIP